MPTFTGDGSANFLAGSAGDDMMSGLGGNDTLDGGPGNDIMRGGVGDDFYLIDSSSDRVIELVGEGFDTAFTSVSFSLEAGSEVEALRARDPSTVSAMILNGNEFSQILSGDAGANRLYGHAGDDYLEGRGGSDTLDGGSGKDVLRGGVGSDYYFVDDRLDRVLEAAGEGYDAVFTAGNFELEAGAEFEELRVLDAAGASALNLTGNEFGQVLAGNSGANILNGGGGNDYLEARGGSDTLDGGSGNDVLRGGAGNDYYFIDSGGDRVLEALGEGFDTAFTTVSFALEAGSETDALRAIDPASGDAVNLTGNELGQVLAGNAGANVLNGGGGDDYLEGRGGIDTLDGGSGNDVLRGGSGGDYYLVDASDRVLEAAGEGYDAVFASSSFTLETGAEIEELRIGDAAGVAALNLNGNEFGQVLAGNDGGNLLSGSAGDDYLEGRGGSDTLDGGTGNDVLRGGAGDDYYLVDSATDRVLEAGNEGHDTVFTATNFQIEAGSAVEALRATDPDGLTALNLSGNEIAQILAGNAGANSISGGGGNDYLEGRGGSDRLDGGAGEDVLRGGAGNDYYTLDQANDRVLEAAGEGHDTVYTSVSFSLEAGAEVEELRLHDVAATTALNLTGNAFGQVLVGNAGANLIDAGGGDDTLLGLGGNDQLAGGDGGDILDGGDAGDRLEGGLGSDRLTGGAGADRFVYSTAGATDVDVITDFNVSEDRIVLNGDPGSAFSGFATGVLPGNSDPNAGASVPAPGAPRIISNGPAGLLWYDIQAGAIYFDAPGGQDAVILARVTPGVDLRASNFVVEGLPNHNPSIVSANSATVLDHTPATTVVYRIQATDPDGDALSYSISGADAQYLALDPSGAVQLRAEANAAVKSTYDFTIWAYETNGEGVSKTVTLNIAPDPSQSPYVKTEIEGNDTRFQATALDRAQFRVTANDNLVNDDLPSARINGSASSPTDKDFFSITLNAGEQLILDIDGTTTLDSYVRVFDQNGNELTSNDDLGIFDPGSTAHPGIGHNMDSMVKFRAPTSGTFYFSVEAFDETSAETNTGAYVLNVSSGPPATAVQLLEEDIQALLSGSSWGTINLTYSFPTSASQYGSGEAIDERGSFQSLLPAQQTAARQVLTQAANLTDLVFTELSSNPGSAQLRLGRTTDGETAHAYYPGSGDGGDSWYNSVSGDYNFPVPGNYAWTTFLHEIGHALGLKHGHESPALSFNHDGLEYSVMTYRSYTGAATSDGSGYSNEEYGFPQTFMMLDIAALQRMYGADFTVNGSDTVYSWNPSSGVFQINGAVQRTPGDNRVFMTVWDGGGNDTYDLSSYSVVGTGVQIDLRPGEWSLFSDVQRANLGDGRYAVGNVANAMQYNGDARSLIENAIGTSGNDTITGNDAVNRLTAGAGSDNFRFLSVAQSSAAAPDIITDFTDADTLDLSFIDANPGIGGDQSYAFLGTGAFTGVAGQLRYERIGSDVIVFGDVDGDGVADLQIILQNGPDLAPNDIFI